MAIDPNIYALSIELSLNASDAFDTLNDFEESLLDIEEQIVDAAKSAIGKIDNLVSDVDSSIRKLSASILDLSSNTVDIAKSVAGSGIDGIHTSIDMAVESADRLRGVLDSAGENSVSHFTQLNQELVGISDSVANSGIDGIYQSVDSAVESANKLRGVLDSAGVESVDKFTQLNQKFREISGSIADSGIGGIYRSVDLAIESASSLRDTISSTGDMTIDKFDELHNSVDAIADSAGNIKLNVFEDNIGLAERTVDIVDSISFENQLSQLSDAENVVDGIASKYRMITSSDFGPTVSYLDTMSSRLNDILLVIDKSSNSFRQLLSTMEDSNSRLSMIYVGQDASFKNLLSTMESGNDKLLLTYTGQNAAFSDLSDSMSSTTDNFSNAISVNRRDIVKLFSDTAEYGGEIFLIYDNILDDTNSISSNIDDQLVNMKKQYDLIVETNDIYDKMKKFEDEETDNLTEHLKLFTDIYKAIEIKNKGHEEEIGLVQSEIPYIEQAVEAFGRQRDAVGGVARSQFSLYNVMRQVFDLIRMLDEETENFVTSNYRAYGSQQQIVQQSRLLSAEYGILRDVSLEAYKVLGDLKVPRDQLDKYALAVAQATRYTGVGVTELAEYAGKMRQVGFDAADMQRQMLFASYAMRTFGLSAKDLSTILGGTSISAAELELIFKGEDQAAKYDKMKMVFTGLAGQLGFAAEQANEFFNNLNDPVQRKMFGAYAQMNINSTEDMMKAISKAGDRIGKEYARLDKAIENGADSTAVQIEMENIAKAYGFGSKKSAQMVAAFEKQRKVLGFTVDDLNDYEKALEVLNAVAMDPYLEANDSLTAQLRILRDEGVALIGYFLQPASDLFKEFLKILNYTIQFFTSVIAKIRKFIVYLEGLWIIGPMIKMFIQFNKIVLSLGFVLTLLISSALLAIASLYVLAGGFWRFIDGLIGHIENAGTALVRFFNNVGRVIVAFLNVVRDVAVSLARIVGDVLVSLSRSLGTALLYLGNSIRSVMVPLIALGFALMMTGAGAYMFAKSVAVIADVGWAAIPAMLGMIAAIGVLGLVLIGLGHLATAAAPGLLVIGATFLMIGAGAMALGHGVKLAAEAFQIFTNSVKQITDGELIQKFASELRAAALDLMIAAPLLFVASSSLLPASVMLLAAGIALSAALYFFSGIDESLVKTGETIKSFAMSFADASTYFDKVSITSIISAMAALAALSLGIGAAWLLFPVKATQTIGDSLKALGIGFQELSTGLADIKSTNISEAYGSIKSAANMIKIISELSLDDAVDNIGKLKIIGSEILAASNYLLSGSIDINTAFANFKDFGSKILSFSEDIIDAMPKFDEGVKLLIDVAGRLKRSGFELLIASMYLMPSAVMLEYIGNALSSAASGILFAVNTMDGSVDSLSDISASLAGAGGMLIVAGFGMVAGSAALVAGSSLLIASSVVMTAAGLALIPAAISLSAGLYFMSGALERFLGITGTLNTISTSIMLLSTSFRELSTINFGVIDDILAPSVSALPLIDEFAAGISAAANKLNEAVNKFKGPADTLVTTLQNMKSAVDNIGFSGINVGDEMAVVGAKLEEYSALLQQTAERVEIAINSKAIPAIRNAEASGINDAIKSEAISTVQVMDKTEGSDINSKSENLLEAQNALLNKIIELVDSISSKDRTKNLYDLIEQYLGSSPNSESGLISNNLNQWAGS